MTISLQELQLFFFFVFQTNFFGTEPKTRRGKETVHFSFLSNPEKTEFHWRIENCSTLKSPKTKKSKIFFCFKISCPVITRFKNHRNLHTLPSNFFFCLIFFFWMEEIQEKERKKIFNQVVVPGSNIPPKVFGIFVSFTSNFFWPTRSGFLFKRNLTREDRIHFGMMNPPFKKGTPPSTKKNLFRPSPAPPPPKLFDPRNRLWCKLPFFGFKKKNKQNFCVTNKKLRNVVLEISVLINWIKMWKAFCKRALGKLVHKSP